MSKGEGLQIAIVGLGVRAPGVRGPGALWTKLREAWHCFAPVIEEGEGGQKQVRSRGQLQDPYDFDAAFFGYSAAEAIAMDPQHRLFLELCWTALDDAGLTRALASQVVGVFGGTAASTYLLRYLLDGGGDADPALAFLGNQSDHLAARVAYQLGLRGPAVGVQTACSSSLVAVHLACQSLLFGDCDLALAGGVAIGLPEDQPYPVEANGIRSTDGYCRPFGADARGTVFSNGAGVVVLRRLADALAAKDRIWGVIQGSALNNDGRDRVGYTAPGPAGQAEVIRGALQVAGLGPEQLSYVEAHGTGTSLGDPIEIEALTQALRSPATRPGACGVGSLKGNFGHLDAAAGVVGLIKTVLSLEHQLIPATLHGGAPNPKIDWASAPVQLVTEARAWPRGPEPRRAGVSAFGIGGTNVHVIVEEAPTPMPTPGVAGPGPWPLLVSGHTPAAFSARLESLERILADQPEVELPALLAELHLHRQEHRLRRGVVVSSSEEARAWLRSGPPPEATVAGRVAFLCPGQAGVDLGPWISTLAEDPITRPVLEQGARALARLAPELPSILDPRTHAPWVGDTRAEQPWLVLLAVAAATWWQAHGLRAEVVLGHSVGELAAAVISGALSLEEGLSLSVARGRDLGRLPEGAMLVARLPERNARTFLQPGVFLAAINAEEQVVYAGEPAAIERLRLRLSDCGVSALRLPGRYAFHVPSVAAALVDLPTRLADLHFQTPALEWISTSRAERLTPERLGQPDYWIEQAAGPVRFSAATELALAQGVRIFVELGPGEVLSRMLTDRAATVPTFARPERRGLLSALVKAWELGLPVHAQAELGPRRSQVLPSYTLDRRPFNWSGPGRPPTETPRPQRSERRLAAYVPGWQAQGAAIEHLQISGRRQWLLLHDGSPLAEALAQGLSALGQVVSQAELGPEYQKAGRGRYRLRPGNAEDRRALVADLRAMLRVPQHVISCWSSGGALEAAIQGLYATAALASELAAIPQTEGKVRVSMITRRAHLALGEDRPSPEGRAVAVLARALSLEEPRLRLQLLDVDQGEPERLGRRVIDASLRPAERLLLRGRSLFTPSLVELPRAGLTSRLLEEPTRVLVIGALGGIGSTWAEALLREGHQVVGTSRQDRASLVVGREARLVALEAHGPAFRLLRYDPNRDSPAAILAAAQQGGAPIEVVVHAGGGVGHGLLLGQEPAAVAADVAAHLQEHRGWIGAAREFGVRRLWLNTSISASYPSVGQGRYGARHAAVEALAEGASDDTLAISAIAWDTWSQVGMAVEAEWPEGLRPQIQRALEDAIRPADAMALLKEVMPLAPAHFVVSNRAPEEIGRAADLAELEAAGPAVSSASSTQARPELSTTFVPPEGDAEQRVAALFVKALGYAQVGANDDFLELGGHSLMAVQLTAEVRRLFGVELALHELFEHRTVRSISELIEQKIIEQIT